MFKYFALLLCLGLSPIVLAHDDEEETEVEETEECGAPYHTRYEYRQFGDYTRRYFILVDSCGNEIAYSINAETEAPL